MNIYHDGETEIYYFECGCFNQDHLLSFHLCSDDGEVYCNVNLSDFPFWKRVWLATKYVLNINTRWGHYGSWTLDWEDTRRLKRMARKAEKLQLKWLESDKT